MFSFTIYSTQGLEFKETSNYGEVITCNNSEEGKKAMPEEMRYHEKNQTWELVPKPAWQKVVDCKWLFKLNYGQRFKARLVAKCFTQKEGIDYSKVFAPVAKYKTIRMMLALVAQNNWELEQMDFKITFLHG